MLCINDDMVDMFNSKLKSSELVLLRKTAFKNKHKIQDPSESMVYQVVQQPYKGVPVYKTTEREGDGRVKVMNCNLLLPVGTSF